MQPTIPKPEQLSQHLVNIGPPIAKKLIHAGIDTRQKLQKLGAKAAYRPIHTSAEFCSKFNAMYLYALEGAILGCDWRKISE